MFQRILVPTDLTARADRAFEIALQVAGPKAEVTLLHVIETVPGVSFDELKTFYLQLEQKARTAMAQVTRRAGVDVRVVDEVVFGRRAEEIVRFAADREVDLIVLASHRVDPSHERDWGTISYKVGILSPCPVLLVK